MDGSIILVTRKDEVDEKKLQPFLWLRPFDDAVWFMIAARVFLRAFIYWILEVIDHKTDRSRTIQQNPLEAIYKSALALTGNVEFNPRTPASRLFVISMTFWALLIASSYTANLASSLVVEHQPELPIESIEDAIRLRLPLCVQEGTQVEFSITKAFPSASLILIKSNEEILRRTASGECRVSAMTRAIWDYNKVRREVKEGCLLETVGRDFKSVGAGVSMPASISS